MRRILAAAAALLLAVCSYAQSGWNRVEISELGILGKALPTPNPYHRIDTVKYKGFTRSENEQCRVPAGYAVRFNTDASTVGISVEFGNVRTSAPFASYMGFDLYIKKDGQWLWAGRNWFKESWNDPDQVATMVNSMAPGEKECLLYLPLYSELYSAKVCVPEGSKIEKVTEPGFHNRIVFHGSSFTHGVSATRSGMSYPMQFMRRTGLQVVPLGFSGNCKMQSYFADFLEDVQADAYVFDPFSNPNIPMIRERLLPFIDRMVQAHPGKPMIFQRTIYWERENFDTASHKEYQGRRDLSDSLMAIACKKYEDVYYIKPDAALHNGESSTADGIHPNDNGYSLWEASIEEPLLRILGKYGIYAGKESPAAQQQSRQPGGQQNMSEAVVRAFIDRYPDPDSIHNVGSENTIDWQPGYIMFAMEHAWRWSGDERFFNYIRRYVDQHVDEEGNVRQFTPTALDHFVSGYACLLMYERTGEQKYARAAETFRRGFDNYPRTSNEMFIHAQRMPQVWVDGVFMGQIFMARYAKTMGHPEDYEEVIRQITGVSELCGKDNGLMVHAWAEKGKGRWPGDGQSPEVWSEGLGWIAVLLADVFDWMPEDTPGADKVMDILKRLCAGLKDCQDNRTGLWCQVVDKPYEQGNWNETSGSGMFTYLLQKAIDKGYIPEEEYGPVVEKAYRGLLSKCVRNTDGFYNILDCSSIGVKRSYEEYISQTKEVSCFTSFASVILGAGAVEWRRAHPKDSPLYDFWCTDYSQGKVLHLVDGQPVWSHDAPLSNDLWVLKNGNVLFTTGNGALEMTQKGDTVFNYSTSGKVFAVQRLANGNTFIGECTDGRLLEVSPKGKVLRSVNILPEGARKDDGLIRNARKLANGHYLVAGYSMRKAVEYDSKGHIVWEKSVPGGAHSVAQTKDGHTIVAAADKDKNPCITEFDSSGNVVWQLTNDDLQGQPLKFMSGFQYLPESDSFLLTNWQGHNVRQKGPHILWVSRNKKILGTFGDSPCLETVSSIFIPSLEGVH